MIYQGWTESPAQSKARKERMNKAAREYKEQCDLRDALVVELDPIVHVFCDAIVNVFCVLDDEMLRDMAWLNEYQPDDIYAWAHGG